MYKTNNYRLQSSDDTDSEQNKLGCRFWKIG